MMWKTAASGNEKIQRVSWEEMVIMTVGMADRPNWGHIRQKSVSENDRSVRRVKPFSHRQN
jgi:hypothetical protein